MSSILQISADYARQAGVILLPSDGLILTLALRENYDPKILIEVRRYLRQPFDIVTMNNDEFSIQYKRLYGQNYKAEDQNPFSKNIPYALQNFFFEIIAGAAREQAKELYVECSDEMIIISVNFVTHKEEIFRLPTISFPTFVHDLIQISNIKNMTQISKKSPIKAAQGLIPYSSEGTEILIPIICGVEENYVFFVIELSPVLGPVPPIEIEGLTGDRAMNFSNTLLEKNGLILIVGPENSGRTKSIISALNLLNDGNRKLVFIHDEDFADFPNIHQVDARNIEPEDLHERLQKLILQRPDAIFVDVFINRKCLDILLDAALASQLVILSINQHNSISAIQYLRDLKADIYKLSMALRLVMTVRVAPKLCSSCKKPVQSDRNTASLLGFDHGTVVYTADGCLECENTGVNGKTGVAEIIEINDQLRRIIFNGANEVSYSQAAYLNQMSLGAAARKAVREGNIKPQEAINIMNNC